MRKFDDGSPKGRDNDPVAQFSKDKRAPRSAAAEQGTSSYKKKSPSASHGGGSGVRRSFNPNFTTDNKLTGRDDRSTRAPREDSGDSRPAYNSDKPSYGSRDSKPSYGGDKPSYGSKPAYGSRDSKPSYGGDKPSYGSRDSKPSYGGDKPSYGSKPAYGSRDSKPSYGGDKPSYGSRDAKQTYGNDKPSYGSKGGYDKPKFASKERSEGGKSDREPRANAAEGVRLNRYIANSGVCSRREADDLIASGTVSVNGVIVVEMGLRVLPTDQVRFNEKTLKGEEKVYILMNKPKGFVTTVEDPHADRTVVDIVKSLCPQRVYPVGRLDKNSLGVLLLTNDGDLTRQLTHPSFDKRKIYQVTLDKPLTKADLEQIIAGVTLEDGEIVVDDAAYVDAGRKEIGIEIHSGRNRIVRRIFESLGYKVNKLDRVFFAGLTKKNLRRGAWRYLTATEIAMLKSGSYQ